MEAIVAIYDDWGIGCCGTQPVALSVDRKFFREQTKGACVIVGRKTLADFPGGRPLPNRVNIVISRGEVLMEGVTVVRSPEEAAELAKQYPEEYAALSQELEQRNDKAVRRRKETAARGGLKRNVKRRTEV